MHAILEGHREPVCHDLLIAVGCLNAQLIELQELGGVDGAVVARRQVRLELAWPDDVAELWSECAASYRGHRRSSRGWKLVLVHAHRHLLRWYAGLVLGRWKHARFPLWP